MRDEVVSGIGPENHFSGPILGIHSAFPVQCASPGGVSRDLAQAFVVIARSEATKQSRTVLHGLLRCARNDGFVLAQRCASFNFQTANSNVIASEAKQSIARVKQFWIASSLRSSQ
jgi:hypothetical protein